MSKPKKEINLHSQLLVQTDKNAHSKPSKSSKQVFIEKYHNNIQLKNHKQLLNLQRRQQNLFKQHQQNEYNYTLAVDQRHCSNETNRNDNDSYDDQNHKQPAFHQTTSNFRKTTFSKAKSLQKLSKYQKSKEQEDQQPISNKFYSTADNFQ